MTVQGSVGAGDSVASPHVKCELSASSVVMFVRAARAGDRATSVRRSRGSRRVGAEAVGAMDMAARDKCREDKKSHNTW